MLNIAFFLRANRVSLAVVRVHGGATMMQELESIGGPKEATLYLACCYYYMQMFDKVGVYPSCCYSYYWYVQMFYKVDTSK